MSVGAMGIAEECVRVERAKRDLLVPRDELDRKVPRQLGVLAFAAGIPGFIQRFRLIDAGYFDVEDGRALCWCPCMSSAPAPAVGGFAGCSRCGRVFVFDGVAVWVARP